MMVPAGKRVGGRSRVSALDGGLEARQDRGESSQALLRPGRLTEKLLERGRSRRSGNLLDSLFKRRQLVGDRARDLGVQRRGLLAQRRRLTLRRGHAHALGLDLSDQLELREKIRVGGGDSRVFRDDE